MKFHITKINLDIDTKPQNIRALSSMAWLKTPKKLENTYKFEDIVAHGSKLGIVMETQGAFCLVHYLKCAGGVWTDLEDTSIVRCDELKKVDHTKINDSVELGCAVLYRGIGSQTADYPEYIEETSEEDHVVRKFW